MFFKKESVYAGKSKQELKERLQVLNYEVATIKDKKQLKKFYKEIEEIQKELIRIRKEEKESIAGRRFK